MIDYTSAMMAEKTLEGCVGCNGTCHECPNLENTLDSLMLLIAYEQEISVLEDAYDAEIEYCLSIA